MLIYNLIITGIVQAVPVLVMKKVNVVMAAVMLMKTVNPAKLTVVYAANVVMVR